MKKFIMLLFPLLGAVVLSGLGMYGLLNYRAYTVLEDRSRKLQQGVEIADATQKHDQAVSLYEALAPATPEVDLRILQRQWSIALDILHQIQLAKHNPILDSGVPRLYNALQDHLDRMKERCNYVLGENDLLSKDVAWRVYNIRGSVNILKSFLILENERNWKKVMGIIRDALSDFKVAIEKVDRTPQAMSFEKNIPRWNLELLHGEEIVKKIQMTTIDTEQRLDLKDNLEAIIPEKGGYAPGEPLERKIRK